MKERKDYCMAEFSTWRSHSVLMSKAGVPPQCRAQQVVNFLRASVPRSVIAERRMLTSHHTGIHILFSNFAKDERTKKLHHKQRIVTYTTPTECPRRSSPTQFHTNSSFFFPSCCFRPSGTAAKTLALLGKKPDGKLLSLEVHVQSFVFSDLGHA